MSWNRMGYVGLKPRFGIIVVLDNFWSHVARATRELTESLGIVLVYLSPYSPDLNPIEQVWKVVRRKISQNFVRCEYSFRETIRATFHMLAKRKAFISGWLREFQPCPSKKIWPQLYIINIWWCLLIG